MPFTDPLPYDGSDAGIRRRFQEVEKTFLTVAGPIFNVSGYGADANGRTDSTRAIQQAVDDASTAGGGQVYFPAGTYLLSATIQVQSNVFLVGAGIAASILKIGANGMDAVTFLAGNNNNGISNLEIEGNKSVISGASHGIVVRSDSTVVSFVRVQNTRNNGIEIDGGDFVQVLNSQLASTDGSAVRVVASANDCVIQGNTVSGCSNGIFVYDNATGAACFRTKILGNTIEACTGTSPAQAQDGGIAANGCPYTFIQGNLVRGNTGRGIHVFGNCNNSVIVGNSIIDCGQTNKVSGLDLGDVGDQDFVVSANQVYRSGAAGLFVAGLRRSVIGHNVFADNGQTSTVAENRNGITIGTDTATPNPNDNVYIANICFDNQTTQTQEYGIREWGGASSNYENNAYIANNCRSNKTGAMLLLSTNSIVTGNLGTTQALMGQTVAVGTTGVRAELAGDGTGPLYLAATDSASATLVLNHPDARIYFGSNIDTDLYRSTSNQLKTDDKLITMLGLGVGNSVAATTASGVASVTQVFDSVGVSIGYVPIYSTFA